MTTPETDYLTPWSLRIYSDGTEDIAVILESDGEELAYSRPFWIPEGIDPVSPTLAAMRLMAAAPKLLTALIECARLLADHDEQDGEEGDAYREAMAAITEATGRAAGRCRGPYSDVFRRLPCCGSLTRYTSKGVIHETLSSTL